MNVLEKIKHLQKERGWSNYELSKESGITQSTISNMFLRNTCPTIPTLSLICEAFGITLAEFFSDSNNQSFLSKEEKDLINNYRCLKDNEKEAITSMIIALKTKK